MLFRSDHQFTKLFTKTPEYLELYESKLASSLIASKMIGNLYTASLYLGFRSSLEFEYQKDGSGPHTMGKAIDIAISGRDAKRLYKIARKYMTGIGISKRYIHMDSLTSAEAPRPTVWRYS